jgi:hypothetical protein
MDRPDLFARYDSYRSQCVAHMQQASAVLEGAGAADAATLAMLRWQYVRLLTEFDAFKQREIFEPALRSASPDKAALASELQAECTAIGQAFRAYVLEWSAVDKHAQWHLYYPAAKAIIERIEKHFDEETPLMQRLLA